MKAAVRERYGRPEDVVELRDLDRPTPVDDQVLVRVRAASVNRADLDGLGPKPGFARFFMGVRAPAEPSDRARCRGRRRVGRSGGDEVPGR